jgi:hypothetical protein
MVYTGMDTAFETGFRGTDGVGQELKKNTLTPDLITFV